MDDVTLLDISETLDRIEEELLSYNRRLALKMGESLNFADIFKRLDKLEEKENENENGNS